MLPKLSYLMRGLVLLVIIFSIFSLTVVIVRTPSKFFVYLWQDTKRVFVDALFPPTLPPTPTPIPTPITTFLPSHNLGKKIFRNVTAGFEIEVSERWVQRQSVLEDPDQKFQGLSYIVSQISEDDFDQQKLFKLQSGDLGGYLREEIKGLCGETDSCGKILSAKYFERSGVKGLHSVILYGGLGYDNPRVGSSIQLQEMFWYRGVLYIFRTAYFAGVPEELRSRYPVYINPTVPELFDQIMSTLKFL